MRCEQQFSNLVYDYFLMRFRFGFYTYGDYLPTIDSLCRAFCVSSQTIKAAYKRLRVEGFIKMQSGKPAMVIYQQTEKELSDSAARYFSERESAYPDLSRTRELISIPLVIEGFRRTDNKEFDHLQTFIERADCDDVLYFFCYILQKLENPLVMNLFWETFLFVGLIYIGENIGPKLRDKDPIRKKLKSMISYRKEQDYDGLYKALCQYQKDAIKMTSFYAREHIQPTKKQGQVPFIWRIYRERPQLCYSLSICILYEVYLGEYRDIQFLPPYGKLADKYSVSLSTIRRTIHLLNKLGAARTINGKGTRVYTVGQPCPAPDFTDPAVRRILAYVFQAIELLMYTCEEVTRDTLLAITPEALSELVEQLEQCLHSNHYELALWHILIWIAKYSPLHGVREIYGKLFGQFLWSNSLKGCQEETSAFTQTMRSFAESLIESLLENDIERCVRTVKEFITAAFPDMESYMIKNGIQPDELRLSPSIRLILTEDAFQ